MARVVKFTFNPFQENTYLVIDETKSCAIVDPGCSTPNEEQALSRYIRQHDLLPVRLLNTHCHIDHIFGNRFVAETYGLGLEIHRGELPVLMATPVTAQLYGIPFPDQPLEPAHFLEDGDVVTVGNTALKVLLTPGHSPASISFFCEEDRFLLAGDVLFHGSIGRTDLPGGDYQTLISSIVERLLPLGDEVTVYSGHGPETTLGYERVHNPFLT